MNTDLVRSSSAATHRRQINGGGGGGAHKRNHDEDNHQRQRQQQQQQVGWSMRTFSKRVSDIRTRSYRAKQRQIFLNSFKLETAETFQRRRGGSNCRKLKKVAVKVAKAVDSVLSFFRIGSCRSRPCDGRLSIRASDPIPLNERR